jgi:hypothetical protein
VLRKVEGGTGIGEEAIVAAEGIVNAFFFEGKTRRCGLKL